MTLLKNVVTVVSTKLTIVYVSCILLYSCTNDTLHNNGKVFRYNESKGIVSLDPAFARNQATIWPVTQIYCGLLQIDDSLNVKPCISKCYTISPNEKEYTFNLRTNVYFHNNKVFKNGIGRKVTASDFVFSFNRILDPATASPGKWIFGMVDVDNVYKGFKAVNDSTLKIYLKKPFAPFSGLLTMPYCYVVPHEGITSYGKEFRSNPIGTGAFKLKLWVEGEKLVLLKNENYFEKDAQGLKLPRIDAVSITFIADKQSEFLEFMKGRLDFISGVNAAFKDELLTKSGTLNPAYSNTFTILTSSYLNTEYLGFMVDSNASVFKESALYKKEVRQAINMAIDKKKMLLFLRNNIGTPANSGIVPKGMPGYDLSKSYGFTYNPDASAKLLTEAGYPNGKGLKPITVTTVSDYLDICEFVQHELSMIGIKLEIEVVTGLAYREMISNAQMQCFRASWVADYADAENYLALFYSKNFSPSGPNYSHFKNAAYDKLYEKSLSETDMALRSKLYAEMEKIVIAEAAFVPLFYDVAVRFSKKNIHNLGINPLNLLNLKYVDISN